MVGGSGQSVGVRTGGKDEGDLTGEEGRVGSVYKGLKVGSFFRLAAI